MNEMAPKKGRSLLSHGFAAGFGLAAGLGVLLLVGLLLAGRLWDAFNPFGMKTLDRSQPTVLAAIVDLAELRAASAQFNVIVDVEKDAKWLPSAIRGERTVLVASGSVDAGVDLSRLGPEAVVVDGTRATVTLPHASLGDPHLDLDSAQVVVQDRGLFDRIGSAVGGSPTGEREALELAEHKLAEAARKSDVIAVAERNASATISALLKSLGFTEVTIAYAYDPSEN